MQLLQNHTELKGGPKMVPFGYLGKLCLHIDIYLLTSYFEIKKKKVLNMSNRPVIISSKLLCII